MEAGHSSIFIDSRSGLRAHWQVAVKLLHQSMDRVLLKSPLVRPRQPIRFQVLSHVQYCRLTAPLRCAHASQCM